MCYLLVREPNKDTVHPPSHSEDIYHMKIYVKIRISVVVLKINFGFLTPKTQFEICIFFIKKSLKLQYLKNQICFSQNSFFVVILQVFFIIGLRKNPWFFKKQKDIVPKTKNQGVTILGEISYIQSRRIGWQPFSGQFPAISRPLFQNII